MAYHFSFLSERIKKTILNTFNVVSEENHSSILQAILRKLNEKSERKRQGPSVVFDHGGMISQQANESEILRDTRLYPFNVVGGKN